MNGAEQQEREHRLHNEEPSDTTDNNCADRDNQTGRAGNAARKPGSDGLPPCRRNSVVHRAGDNKSVRRDRGCRNDCEDGEGQEHTIFP